MKVAWILVLLATASASCSSLDIAPRRGTRIERFEQQLWHAPPSPGLTGSFSQKTMINSDHATSPDAPVLYYFSSERDLPDDAFDEPLVTIARELGAHFVALENRFYGTSQPFDLLTTENLSSLRFEEILADYAAFQVHLQRTRGLRGPWFAIGGSFGGTLASSYRVRYPELATGAVVSSGHPRFTRDWVLHDRQAASVAGPACVRALHERVLAPLEAAITQPGRMAELKATFDAADIANDLDFIGAVGSLAAVVVQFAGPDALCDPLASDDPMSKLAAAMRASFLTKYHLRPVDFTPQAIADPRAASHAKGIGMRQWTYQCCREMGLGFPNPDPSLSLQSRAAAVRVDAPCREIFGIEFSPATDALNDAFYRPLLEPTTTRLMFVNGGAEPALGYSIAPENGNSTNPNIVSITIPGETHCGDLRAPQPTDSSALVAARAEEVRVLKRWVSEHRAGGARPRP